MASHPAKMNDSSFISSYFTPTAVPKRRGRSVSTWNNLASDIMQAIKTGMTGAQVTINQAPGTIYQQGTKALKKAGIWETVKLTKTSNGDVFWYKVGSKDDPKNK